MQIRQVDINDLERIRVYDAHIPAIRLQDCILRAQVYGLYDDSELIGVLRYSFFWQVIPFLDLIYIDEAFRGRGYGKYFMEFWENLMKRSGYSYVMLSTQEDESAKYFYEKLDYRRIGSFLPPEQSADEIIYIKEFVGIS